MRSAGFAQITAAGVGEAVGVAAVAHREAAPVQSDRIQSIFRIAGGLAHDLNNVMQVVRNSVELIRRNPNDAEQVLRRAESALSVIDGSARLSTRMLAFCETVPPDVAMLAVGRHLWALRETLNRVLGARVLLHIDLACDPGDVQVDASQLTQSIVSIAHEAREAMVDGGEFTLSCRRARVVHDPELPSGLYMVIGATYGNRSGNDKSDAPDERAGEVGLGLSQVFAMAKRAGGTLRIASSEVAGVTVTLLLPVK